jgi:hypothetical protein
VDRLDDVRPRDHEVIVAADEMLAAEVGGAQLEALDRRPHRAVVDEDALLQDVEVIRCVGHEIPVRMPGARATKKKPSRFEERWASGDRSLGIRQV